MNIQRYVDGFETRHPQPSINYRDQSSSGNLTEKSYDLNNLSKSLQQRSFCIRDYELRNILDWAPISKSGGDVELRNRSKTRSVINSAFDNSNSIEDRVSALCELKGFNVQAAAAILTTHSPSEFGFITHGSIRALAVEAPHLTDPVQYKQFAQFTDWIRYLPYRPSIYEKYTNELQKIWPNSQLHEIGRALIAYNWEHI